MANISLLVVECSRRETKSNTVLPPSFSPSSHLIYSFSALHHRKLFYANEIFQGVLIHVKAMCEVYYFGQINRVKPFYLLDRYAYQETLTLQEFTQRQFAQMDQTLEKLMNFIDQVAVLASNACQVKFCVRVKTSSIVTLESCGIGRYFCGSIS